MQNDGKSYKLQCKDLSIFLNPMIGECMDPSKVLQEYIVVVIKKDISNDSEAFFESMFSHT